MHGGSLRMQRWLALAGLVAGLWLGLNAEPRRAGMAADRAAIYALLLGIPTVQDAPGWQPVRRVQSAPAVATYMDLAASGTPPEYQWLLREFPRAAPATVADFTRRQEDRSSLRGVLPRGGVWLVRAPAGVDGEDSARRPYYAFSQIGFDPGRTQAVAYASHVCGTTCGAGHYVFLERTGGRWQISSMFMAWIS